MKASEFLNGTYLKKEDLQSGPRRVLVTEVEAVEAFDKQGKVLQLVLDDDKRLALNATNTRLLITHYGDDTNAWIGQRLVVYFDDTVAFKGKPVGGIRIRPPKPPAARTAPVPPVTQPDPEDEDAGDDAIPF